ncbi:galactinol--sucrose galactosyltransferase, partial [Sarracenia purpurea var. burkii]
TLQLNARFSSSFQGSNQRVLFSHGSSVQFHSKWRKRRHSISMFLNPKPILKDGVLSLNGKNALTGVPDNVILTPFTDSYSVAFVGATSAHSSSRLVFKLGVLP